MLEKDVTEFGLNHCLEEIISELKILVTEGYYDEYTDTTVQVRLICSLG